MNALRVIAASLAIAGSACAQPQPGFWLPGFPSGSSQAQVVGLSQHGSVALGSSLAPGFLAKGFTWTRDGGRVDFGLGAGMPAITSPTGLSSDGLIHAGFTRPSSSGPLRAYRRVESGQLQDLGVLPGRAWSGATGISGDGSVVVGTSYTLTGEGPIGQAFRWTESGGMQALGYLLPNGYYSNATAISRDGSTIVGTSRSDGGIGDTRAFRWTQTTGMQELPGLGTRLNEALAVSADGTVSVGRSQQGAGPVYAVRWTGTAIENLGTLPGFEKSGATCVNDDGSVIGGFVSGSPATQDLFLWTPGTGMMLLRDYLLANGAVIPIDFALTDLEAISGDGLTFAGEGYFQGGISQGFVLTIPAPGPGLLVLLASAAVCRRRRG